MPSVYDPSVYFSNIIYIAYFYIFELFAMLSVHIGVHSLVILEVTSLGVLRF